MAEPIETAPKDRRILGFGKFWDVRTSSPPIPGWAHWPHRGSCHRQGDKPDAGEGRADAGRAGRTNFRWAISSPQRLEMGPSRWPKISALTTLC